MDKLSAQQQDKFEESFFNLAYEKLQDKLPNLLNYLVGFEVINKSDDKRKAVGVFGFKSNQGQIVFVPVFFRDGSVKQLDMLYSKNYEQFYPLNEEWANTFLTDGVGDVGEKSKEDRNTIRKNRPAMDLRDFVIPPRTGKMTYASVIDFVKDGDNKTKEAFEHFIEKKADYLDALMEFYPLDKIAEALARKEDMPVTDKVEGSLKVVTTENTVEATKLPKEKKEKLLSKGYVIIDKRNDDQASKFGVIEYENKFTNPQTSGFGQYLTQEGKLHEALFLLKPINLDTQFNQDKVIVVDLYNDKGNTYVRKPSEVFVKDMFDAKDFNKFMDKLEVPSEATPKSNQWFVLVNENLASIGPFEIKQNYKDANDLRRIVVSRRHVSADIYRTSGNRFFDNTGNLWAQQFRDMVKTQDFTLVFTKRAGNTLEHRGDVVYVPKGFKLLPVNTEMYDFGECGHYSDLCCSVPTGANEDADIKSRREARMDYCNHAPGGLHKLVAAMYSKNIFPLSARKNGSDYWFALPNKKKKYASLNEATIGLVMDFGLREKAAEELIDSLTPDIQKVGYIKVAYTGDYTPPIQEEQPYANELGQLATTGIPYQHTENPGDGYKENPTSLGRGVMPDMEGAGPEIDTATQLAQSGQKEMFDAQSIATLSKYVNGPDKVMSYVPSLITALDNIGRVKFLLAWEAEKFKDSFGADDLPEFNEIATSVFKNLGDFILKLRQVNPSLSLGISSGEQE
jgi:hypothetical protein